MKVNYHKTIICTTLMLVYCYDWDYLTIQSQDWRSFIVTQVALTGSVSYFGRARWAWRACVSCAYLLRHILWVGSYFFVFPYPPFQFLKLVVIAWWVVAAILSVKRIIWSAELDPGEEANEGRSYSPAVVPNPRFDVRRARRGCRLFTKRALGAKVFVWVEGFACG